MTVEVRGESYHLDKGLKEKWDKLREGGLAKYDEDRFYIVDGEEGCGKSVFTIQQGAYIDPTILDDADGKVLPRICFTAEEFHNAVRNTKSTKEHTKVVIFDEAFRGLSSKSSLSKNNRMIVQTLMEARQNNLIVFIVSPSFYLIEFYAAVLRSKALFHVVKEKKTRRRYVRVFGRKDKNILYQIGVRKGWGYPRKTKFRVRFFNKYPGGAEFEARYRKKKLDSFRNEDPEETLTHRWKEERNNAIKLLYKQGLTQQKIADLMREAGSKMTHVNIHYICSERVGKKVVQ